MLRHFFSYVPPEPPDEVPEIEPPDPNTDRVLPEAYRAARRVLVLLCAGALTWSIAQVSLADGRAQAAGLTIDLRNASIPLLVGAGIVYLTARWMLEYAMMSRHIRRWPLAQLDFRLVITLVRVSLLATAASALERSSRTITALGVVLGSLALSVIVLTVVLMFVSMPVRVRARRRANRPSAANAAIEAIFWAGSFAICLTVIAAIASAFASYRYEWVRRAVWRSTPDPIALSAFTLVLIGVFLSYWLLRPVTNRIFAKRPSYRTKRGEDGSLILWQVGQEKEPLV